MVILSEVLDILSSVVAGGLVVSGILGVVCVFVVTDDVEVFIVLLMNVVVDDFFVLDLKVVDVDVENDFDVPIVGIEVEVEFLSHVQ